MMQPYRFNRRAAKLSKERTERAIKVSKAKVDRAYWIELRKVLAKEEADLECSRAFNAYHHPGTKRQKIEEERYIEAVKIMNARLLMNSVFKL